MSSSGAVRPYSGVVHMKSFPAAPSSWFAVTILLGTNCASWGRENQRKGKKEKRKKKKNRLLKLQK